MSAAFNSSRLGFLQREEPGLRSRIEHVFDIQHLHLRYPESQADAQNDFTTHQLLDLCPVILIRQIHEGNAE